IEVDEHLAEIEDEGLVHAAFKITRLPGFPSDSGAGCPLANSTEPPARTKRMHLQSVASGTEVAPETLKTTQPGMAVLQNRSNYEKSDRVLSGRRLDGADAIQPYPGGVGLRRQGLSVAVRVEVPAAGTAPHAVLQFQPSGCPDAGRQHLPLAAGCHRPGPGKQSGYRIPPLRPEAGGDRSVARQRRAVIALQQQSHPCGF